MYILYSYYYFYCYYFSITINILSGKHKIIKELLPSMEKTYKTVAAKDHDEDYYYLKYLNELTKPFLKLVLLKNKNTGHTSIDKTTLIQQIISTISEDDCLEIMESYPFATTLQAQHYYNNLVTNDAIQEEATEEEELEEEAASDEESDEE